MSLTGSNPFRGAITQTRDFSEYLRDRRLADTTIEYKLRLIRHLELRFNLWESDTIREYLKNYSCGGRRKNNISYAYRDWCRWKGFDYEIEKFKEEHSNPRAQSKLPYIPTERELDQLIAGFGPKYSTFLQLLKETGFRSIEARRLRPFDFDLDRKIVTLNDPAKGSRPRQFKTSDQLISMLIPLIHKTSLENRIWSAKANTVRAIFCRKRKQLAEKLGNPKLNRITLHTFRHWKATMEYHKTKDILYVKNLLGHKSIKNTLVYTHLVSFEEDDAWVVKVASSIEEYVTLLEAGFTYVSDYEGRKVLRKRK